MPYYQKKPIVVEAIQWTGGNLPAMREFAGPTFDYSVVAGNAAVCDKLHGGTWIPLELNDWVIKGVQGEFYPCKNTVFEETYREVRTAEGNK